MSSETTLPSHTITIDGIKIQFTPGESIMQVAVRSGRIRHIPHYCYHPDLSVAGTCRMCTVEVEKAPKLVTACSTPAADGMVVFTQSERVRRSREGVMESLLANHPLDCPVCDQAGECSLQEYNYEYGPGTSNFMETKRIFPESTTRRLSEMITLNMNRCVHCERCVRFCSEVTKSDDLVMLNRGWKKELTLADEAQGLTSDYQGCLADICPVGALTLNDFRFQKRVWFLKKQASLCDRCSKGCNLSVHFEAQKIYRLVPRVNRTVNYSWLCDEGRLAYHDLHAPSRVRLAYLGNASASWEAVRAAFQKSLASAGSILVLMGTDLTNEEIALWQSILPSQISKHAQIKFAFVSNLGMGSDVHLDHLLRMQDRTPNRAGLIAKGVLPWENHTASTYDLVIVAKNARTPLAWFALDQLAGQMRELYLWAVVSQTELAQLQSLAAFRGLIPARMTFEKQGSYTNCDQITQSFAPVWSRLSTEDEVNMPNLATILQKQSEE